MRIHWPVRVVRAEMAKTGGGLTGAIGLEVPGHHLFYISVGLYQSEPSAGIRHNSGYFKQKDI